MAGEDAWPHGVLTELDMGRWTRCLFPGKEYEDLLLNTCFASNPGCFLWRVKEACAPDTDFGPWPELVEGIMDHVVLHA